MTVPVADGEPPAISGSPEPSPRSGPPRRFLPRFVDEALFGYDVFISYAHDDGRRYAEALHEALTSRGYRCFLDRDDMPPGEQLSIQVRRGLERSRVLVLVATPRALSSRWVCDEVRRFAAYARTIIPLDLLGTLERAPRDHSLSVLLADIIRLPAGDDTNGPSDHVIRQVQRSFRHTRQLVRRQRWLTVVAILLVALTIGVSVAALVARQQKREADRRRMVSLAQTLAAVAPQLQQERHGDDVAALLARLSWQLHQRFHGDHEADIESALRRVLDTPYFSATLRGHHDQVHDVAYRHDGAVLASSHSDGAVLLWDVERPGPPLLLGMHEGGRNHGKVHSLAFCEQGSLLLSGGEDRTVRLWDTDGRETPRVLLVADAEVRSVRVPLILPAPLPEILTGRHPRGGRRDDLEEPDRPA